MNHNSIRIYGKFDELSSYLNKLDRKYEGEPVFQEEPEEYAEDIPTASKELISQTSGGILKIKFDEISQTDIQFKYFIDGVVETRVIRKINVKGITVPIHLVVCGAGVFERTDEREINPISNSIVLLRFIAFPYTTLKEMDSSLEPPPGVRLNDAKPLFDNLGMLQKGAWLDTSVSFGRNIRVIERQDLLKTGYVRVRARNEAKIIMRILEVGVLYLLKNSKIFDDNYLIAFDGPISPLHIYAKLVSEKIFGLYELSDKNVSYNMLKNVVGCVKRVYKVPSDDTFYTIFNRNIEEQIFVVYPMSAVVGSLRQESEDESELEDLVKATLSAFTVLRPELSEIYRERVISNMSMVARFDIPLPNICSDEEDWYLNEFLNKVFSDIFPNKFANLSNDKGKLLYKILKGVMIEKYPIPSAHGTRVFTELYPVYEAELWLRSYVRELMLESMFAV
jgi:hypothetical protein